MLFLFADVLDHNHFHLISTEEKIHLQNSRKQLKHCSQILCSSLEVRGRHSQYYLEMGNMLSSRLYTVITYKFCESDEYAAF